MVDIQVKNLSKFFVIGENLLEGLSFEIQEGERVAILGRNGCGKTTFLCLLAGDLAPDSGSVVRGDTVRVGFFTQEFPQVKPELRLIDFMRDIAEYVQTPDGRFSASQMLEQFLFPPDVQLTPVNRLSGGEKRRAALAGIIAMKPRYLVLDEPMAGLDPAGRKAILETLEGIRRDTGCAIIMVSHSMEDVARHSRKIAVMDNGALAAIGTPEEVFGGSLPLEELGLDLPEVSHLGMLLRERGMDIPPVYTVEGMRDHLLGRAKNV